jgi:hypothetical protein
MLCRLQQCRRSRRKQVVEPRPRVFPVSSGSGIDGGGHGPRKVAANFLGDLFDVEDLLISQTMVCSV